MKRKHECPNRYHGEGAKGGCYVEVEGAGIEGYAQLDVGWSCVVVHQGAIPVSWLSEVIAIATGHNGGIPGFLAEHRYGGGQSYALMCDPPKDPEVSGQQAKDEIRRLKAETEIQAAKLDRMQIMLDVMRSDGAKFLAEIGRLSFSNGRLFETLRGVIHHLSDERVADRARAILEDAKA